MSFISPACFSGTVTKKKGEGPRQNQILPLNSNSIRFLPRSFEDEVCRPCLEIPVNQRISCQIEGCMHDYQQPDAACNCEDGSQNEPYDQGLFHTSQPLTRVMVQ